MDQNADETFDHRGALTRRAVCRSLIAAGVAGHWGSAIAADTTGVSEWSSSEHAKVRLVDAGVSAEDAPPGLRRLVGIEIKLDPMYLTYWRSPGEAGVPPDVTFAGSTNVKDATLLYPAPRRFSEDGIEANGYKETVVFPLLVSVEDPGKPLDLSLSFGFAVCERQCIPVHAKLSLPLEGDGRMAEADVVREALARVPAKRALGEAGALAITAVQGTAGQDVITMLAKISGNDVPLLFAEAPDPWFVQPGQGLWINDGAIKFLVKVLSKPAEPQSLPLRLTLVGVDEAIEVSAALDAPPRKP